MRKIYKHLSTSAVAELIEENEMTVKLKDVISNEEKVISLATLKRWWRLEDKLEEQPEEPEGNKDLPIDFQEEPEPLALSDIVKRLEDLFDLLNRLYFEDALPRPIITIQSTPRAYGHCSIRKIWTSGSEGDGESYYEINIGAEYLNRPSENTAATMLHKIVHLYCRENDLKETCQGGRYHNKLFKTEAEARDLQIGYDRARGYSSTTPTEAFIQKLKNEGFELEVAFARHTLSIVPAVRRNKAKAYSCPVCSQTIRTTADINILCGNCEVKMECA